MFGRFGRSGAAGPYATCQSLGLPVSEPRYFFWTRPGSGRMTRRSEWFVTRSPNVRIEGRVVKYLISFVLPRFCDQTPHRDRQVGRYGGETWLAKLDTVIHELYHIDPTQGGIRVVGRCDAGVARAHSPEFFEHVADFVRMYLASDPDPAVYEFLTYDFATLQSATVGSWPRRSGSSRPSRSAITRRWQTSPCPGATTRVCPSCRLGNGRAVVVHRGGPGPAGVHRARVQTMRR